MYVCVTCVPLTYNKQFQNTGTSLQRRKKSINVALAYSESTFIKVSVMFSVNEIHPSYRVSSYKK